MTDAVLYSDDAATGVATARLNRPALIWNSRRGSGVLPSAWRQDRQTR